MKLARRDLLKGSAALAAAALAPKGAPAQGAEKAAVVVVYMPGGYNALHSAADAYVPYGTYGVTASNVRDLGNGVVVDAATIGALSDFSLAKMATIGVLHGVSAHDAAQLLMFNGSQSYPLQLADAMQGSAALRCAMLGQRPPGAFYPVNGVSLSQIPDVSGALVAAGASTSNPELPLRSVGAKGIRAAARMSRPMLEANPSALREVNEGFAVMSAMLEQPAQSFDWAEVAAAYGLSPGATAINDFKSQMAGAELMVRAGADVVLVTHHGSLCADGYFDTHGDSRGECTRAMVGQLVVPTLKPFLDRTLAMPNRNVVTVLMSEFARSGGGSDHAGGLSASVFGRYVRPGTTGRPTGTDGFYVLPPSTPGPAGLWAYLAAVARAPQQPFGPNPHPLVLP